jgi:DNA replication licensing factor MCM7
MNTHQHLSKQSKNDYKGEFEWAKTFLRTFEDPSYAHPIHGRAKYLAEIERTLKTQSEVLEVHIEDLEHHFSSEKQRRFVSNIRKNAHRYVKMFTAAAEDMEVQAVRDLSIKEEIEAEMASQQMENFQFDLQGDNGTADNTEAGRLDTRDQFARQIFKNRFRVAIVPGPNSKPKVQNLRDLKAEDIGALVTVKGTVVKLTEVKPRMVLAAYRCTVCNMLAFKSVSSKDFMPPVICESRQCKQSHAKGNIVPHFQSSKFVSYQEMRIQETSDQSPVGSVPRSFAVHLTRSTVRSCAPGDTVVVDGMFMPQITDGYNHRDPLTHDTYIEALRLTKEKQSEEERGPPSFETIERFRKIARKDNPLTALIQGFAPEIFGMENVKKALLLQMVGGSTLSTGDGLRIRGDLNIALIGDPGIAKSQLLKQIAHLSPRGIYTTGKGSSGAGLTACVSRDPVSNEITLEGGALVLADLGICCIDEFDKMQDSDRVAIHEVMEQQTISLAKAGITTSLNARASILAAANPVFGRYDRKRSPHENIGLPYSLLSRFDLIYILLDRCNEADDLRVAKHITLLHQKHRAAPAPADSVTPKMLQEYVAHARNLEPKLPEHLHQFIVNQYKTMRKSNKDLGKFGQYITPRTLLALIRFAIASAKLRLSDEVGQEDIEIIKELMVASQKDVATEEEEQNNRIVGRIRMNENDQIKQIVKDSFSGTGNPWIDMGALVKSCTLRGFSRDQLRKFLGEYTELGFYQISDDETRLYKVD